jgi:hypothetical protein
MSDCAEAMWKIKMAFRPGNIDMSEAVMIAQNNMIDDVRFFGQVQPDYDYPDLSDMAFEQNILNQYEDIRCSRLLTVSDDRETTQSFEKFGSVTGSSPARSIFDSRLSEINIPDISYDGRHSIFEKRVSRGSDIEIVRGNISSRYSAPVPVRSSGASSNISRFSEDDIPAFNEHENFESEVAPELESFRDFDETLDGIEHPLMPLIVDERNAVENIFDQKKRKNNKKRQKIVVDERVELSGSFYKQHFLDRCKILRRRAVENLVVRKSGLAINKFIVPNSRGDCFVLLLAFLVISLR